MKVLIAVDESEHAEAGFRFYMENLHKRGNRLLLVHSEEPLPPIRSEPMQLLTDALEENMVKIKEHYTHLMKEYHVMGEIRNVWGPEPGAMIIHMAEEHHVSLIVTGTRGMGLICRTILGSVSDYVLHHAQCPVVICRQRERRATEDKEAKKDEAEKPIPTEDKGEKKDEAEKPVVTEDKEKKDAAEKPVVTEDKKKKYVTEKPVTTEDKEEKKDGAEKPVVTEDKKKTDEVENPVVTEDKRKMKQIKTLQKILRRRNQNKSCRNTEM